MKLNLEIKVEAIIKAYNTFSTTQNEEIKAILEPFTVPSYANRFTQEGLSQTIKEQMDEVMSNWKKNDKVFNQSMKAAVAVAKTAMLKALGLSDDVKTPADYAMQIANAREFLKMELSNDDRYMGKISSKSVSEIDNELYSILKDFTSDYNTMKQFKKMVEKKITTFNAYDGDTIFPKTFGKMCKAESIMNTIEELEVASEMLFIYNRTNSNEVIRIKGNAYATPIDGYSQMADEQSIMNNAIILDALADSMDSEGQSYVVENGKPQKTSGIFETGGFDANGQPYTASNPAPGTVSDAE